MTAHGTVLVTGGSRGIGAQTVKLLAKQGYDVCFTYLSQAEAANQVVEQVHADGGRAWELKTDSGDIESVRHLVSRIPVDALPLVALVNNVGITGPLGAFVDTNLMTMNVHRGHARRSR